MPQQSKLLQSRDEWREKAVQRANEIRERRKSEKRNREAIAELQKKNEELKKIIEDVKKTTEFGC
jgi:uncharacterized FlaG/YvyC family protein